jgi:hypothetical protein
MNSSSCHLRLTKFKAGPFAMALIVALPSQSAHAALTSLGPLPYTSPADSPLAANPAWTTHIENFEDGVLNIPGVVEVPLPPGVGSEDPPPGGVDPIPGVVLPPGPNTDSVDGDDGAIDGSGRNGRSHYTGNGGSGIEYTFSSAVLGALPTHAGIVWTDLSNAADVFLEAFDGSNASLGILAAGDLNDGVSTSETAEDRFLGWTHPAGILRIRVYQSGSDMEVDHLQYGILVPEPTAWAMIACAGMLAAMKRRTTPSSRTRRE